MANDIPQWAKDKSASVAKEATRDAMRDPLMPYYITVAPHIARALLDAEARGAERMKERAAEVAESFDKRTDILKISGLGVSMAIRNLEANNG